MKNINEYLVNDKKTSQTTKNNSKILLTSGNTSVEFASVFSTMAIIFMDKLTRIMQLIKQAMNNITATLKRFGILTEKKERKNQFYNMKNSVSKGYDKVMEVTGVMQFQ